MIQESKDGIREVDMRIGELKEEIEKARNQLWERLKK